MQSHSFVLTSRNFLAFILASYAVVLTPFIDAGERNYLVLFAALIGGLLFFGLRLGLERQAFWAVVLFLFMAVPSYYRDGAHGLGSVALTFIYAMGYLAVKSLMSRIEDKQAFVMTVMHGIIYAFAFVSVLQFVTSFAGLPIPNLIGSKGLWSYNSLAFEPSQLGRIVGISMLCYVMIARLPGTSPPAENRWKLTIAFLITMLLSGSSLAALAILAVYSLSRSLVWVGLIIAVSLLMWPIALLVDFAPLQRAVLLLSNLGTLDLNQILQAEHSGGIRIAPLIIYIRDASTADQGFWFGYGTEGVIRFFYGQIPGVSDDIIFAGFLPGFAVVYGFWTFALFVWVFVLRQANRVTLPLIVFWAIFIVFTAWNTQVFWYGLIVIQVAYTTSRETKTSSMVALT